MAPVLGYWNIRGFAQPIRLLLAYAEAPFEEKRYPYRLAPDLDESEWPIDKNSLGLDFPNLPYYIDGDVKITQSVAIMRYLARKFKLEGETEEEILRADVIEQQIVDVRTHFSRLTYFSRFEDPEFVKLKEEFLKNLPAAMKLISDALGKKRWFASQDKLTYVDFLVYEVLDRHRISFAPSCVDDFQNLKEFMMRFEELPTIRSYMQSPDFIRLPYGTAINWSELRRSKK